MKDATGKFRDVDGTEATVEAEVFSSAQNLREDLDDGGRGDENAPVPFLQLQDPACPGMDPSAARSSASTVELDDYHDESVSRT